jgi:F-type H+-transporting ATPase subunit delta
VAAEVSLVSGIAGRYATALFELARERGQLDAVAADLDTLRRALDESDDLNRLVSNPVFGREEQARAMAAVLAALEVSGLVAHFVGVVAENRRLFALRGMIRGFAQFLAAHRGEVVARVASARALTESQLAAIRTELAAAMHTQVSIESEVDPELLGGVVVRVGSRMIDSSIRTKLQNLKFAMKGAE